jgi:TonB family protein
MTLRLQIAVCLFAILPACIHAQTIPAQAPQGTTQAAANYADSPAGLQHFLEDLFAAIKNSDKSKTDSLWQSAVLPDHAAWFARVFGDKEGQALEANYAKQLATSVSGPTKVFTYSADLQTVKFVVMPLAQAAVTRPDSWAKPIYLSLKGPVSAYRAEAIGLGSVDSHMLGYFFYVEGGFRQIDELVFSALSSTKQYTGLPYISSAEAQMLLLQSAPPVTPPLVNRQGISNSVMLNIVIDVLGQVKSATILSGDLVLGNAARSAVLGWRYRPYIQNGRAVEVETTVTVTFPL